MKQLNHDGAHAAVAVTSTLHLVLPVFLQPPSFPVRLALLDLLPPAG
jgi:hypothetical protein